MNLLKSVFIFVTPLYLTLLVALNVSNAIIGQSLLMCLFVILSSSPLLIFLTQLMLLNKKGRTSFHLLPVLIPSALGFIGSFILFIALGGLLHSLALMQSMSAFFLTFLYIYWYSNNNRYIRKELKVGKPLPAFRVFDGNGNPISSQSFAGKKHLLFFIRGNWCPFCMAQIEETVQDYKQFEQLGVVPVFIASQSQQHTQKLANKFQLNVSFYFDKDHAVAKKLGLLHQKGLPLGFQALGYDSDSIYPTIIAVDENLQIIYSDQTDNYRVRPEPKDLLNVFYQRLV